MLKFIRKKGLMKKILWALALLIILSFGILSQSYLIGQRGQVNYAGKMFSERVTLEEFQQNYLHIVHRSKLLYGDNFSKIHKYLNLTSETWDRLILLHEADKRKLTVDDQEVIQTIQEYPFFQRDGIFDLTLYNHILSNVFLCGSDPRFNCTQKDFEEGLRNMLKIKKLFEQETSELTIPEEEILQEYKNENEKVQVSYLLIPVENYKNQVSYTETQIEQYYLDHKNQFLSPPSVNVEYLVLPFPKKAADSEESQDPWQENEDLPTEDIAAKAWEIFNKLQQAPDLKGISETYQLPIQESGFFNIEQPNLKIGWSYELLQKIFQLDPGQMIEPIETAEGYLILKLKEKRDTYIPELPEIKEKVKESFLLEGAKKIAQVQAGHQWKVIKEKSSSQPFPEIAEGLGLQVQQTPLFKRGEYIPAIGLAREFQEAAFSLQNENKISDVIEIGKGFCILHLDTFEAMNSEEYQKTKEEYSKKILEGRRNEAFQDFLTLLRLRASIEDNMSKK